MLLKKIQLLTKQTMKTLLFISICILNYTLWSQTNDSIPVKKKHFELSFGQSLLFISSSKQTTIATNEAIVLPTSAVLLSVEFRPEKRMRIPVFFNLAKESKQFIVNGQIVSEKASPTIGTGALFNVLNFKIDKNSRIEVEAGPLISCLIDTKKSVRFAPILAARIKILRGENFIMYLGTSYSIGINAMGLLYGTGSAF
jgi:hypothetical protein